MNDREREDKITQFQLCVYTVVADIPKGRVSTYTAIARILECSPRAVRLALKRNPFALEVPCHRVIASNMVMPQICPLNSAERS